MIDLLPAPFYPAFKNFAAGITTDCLICSPYITTGPVKMLVDALSTKPHQATIKINILTDLSCRTLTQGSTETTALLHLFDNHPNVHLTYIPKIHAKVYISNRTSAMVTSANFTRGGGQNFEYGVKINDADLVAKIQSDMDNYSQLGAHITYDELKIIHHQVEEIKQLLVAEHKNIEQIIKPYTMQQQRAVEDNLIRARVKHKTINKIFSETILYVLSRGPAKTQHLHTFISDAHPDLCDDSTDRVIDGVRFGKLWKHQVRNAQEYLRRTGAILYDKETRLWHKTPS